MTLLKQARIRCRKVRESQVSPDANRSMSVLTQTLVACRSCPKDNYRNLDAGAVFVCGAISGQSTRTIRFQLNAAGDILDGKPGLSGMRG